MNLFKNMPMKIKKNKEARVKSDLLKQPSMMDLFICALIKLLEKKTRNKKFRCPNRIGQYTLVSDIKKSNNYNNYGIGLYTDLKGKKVFAKTWRAKTKNFPYYSLINEYNNARILCEKFEMLAKSTKFRVPKPIGYLETQNTFSILSEYIEGKLLSEVTVENQAKVINDTVLLFDKIGLSLNREDKKYIKKRDRFFYIFFLPLIFLYSFILEKENKRVIFYSFLRTYFKSMFLLDSKLTLVHGDLDPDNIFISGSHYYILDLEHLKYTLAEYDLSFLSVGVRKASPLLSILKKRKNVRQNIFLCLYIAMQFSIVTDPKTHQRPYFDYLKNYEK